jgi:acyl phosphate:glycerol-3-phosphate acyltransferase
MPSWLVICLPVVLAYVAGATPFGWLAGRLRGMDLREHGSGNIGATNAVRVLGKRIGLPVFALDVLKGWLPVALAAWWVEGQSVLAGHSLAKQAVPVLAGLGAVLGHTFTFWLGFKGGKGVATSAGVMLGLAPLALLVAVAVWTVSMKISRYVSLSSILAGWALPAAVGLLAWRSGPLNPPVLMLALLIAVLVTVRHRSNIVRIAAGTEPKAGAGRTAPPPVS